MTEPIPGLAARASARLRLLSAKVVDRRPLGDDSIDFELAWLADADALEALSATDLSTGVHSSPPGLPFP